MQDGWLWPASRRRLGWRARWHGGVRVGSRDRASPGGITYSSGRSGNGAANYLTIRRLNRVRRRPRHSCRCVSPWTPTPASSRSSCASLRLRDRGPADCALLIATLQEELTTSQREIASLRHQLDVLCQRLLGKKSEIFAGVIQLNPTTGEFPKFGTDPVVPEGMVSVGTTNSDAPGIYGFAADLSGRSVALGIGKPTWVQGNTQIVAIVTPPPFDRTFSQANPQIHLPMPSTSQAVCM